MSKDANKLREWLLQQRSEKGITTFNHEQVDSIVESMKVQWNSNCEKAQLFHKDKETNANAKLLLVEWLKEREGN